MSDHAIEEVAGRWATIRFDGRRCIHARRCVISQPGVFKANVQGDWIDPDAASAEALMFVALDCPSGAIEVTRHDGGAPEPLPKVNTIAIRENGPLAVHAEIERRREQMRSVRDELRLVTSGASRPEQVVLLAVATKGAGVVNQHFGQAEEFWIYEAAPGWAKFVGTRKVDRFCQGPSECFEHETVLERTVRVLADCAAVLCSRIGDEPRRALAAAGIESVEAHDLIDKAVAEVGARHLGAAEPEAAVVS